MADERAKQFEPKVIFSEERGKEGLSVEVFTARGLEFIWRMSRRRPLAKPFFSFFGDGILISVRSSFARDETHQGRHSANIFQPDEIPTESSTMTMTRLGRVTTLNDILDEGSRPSCDIFSAAGWRGGWQERARARDGVTGCSKCVRNTRPRISSGRRFHRAIFPELPSIYRELCPSEN